MNRGINLLGQEKQVTTAPNIKRLRLLRTIAVSLVFGISAASIILFILIALSPLPALQKQEQNSLSTLSQHHPDMAKIELINDRLKTTRIILDKRNDFDKTLDAIKKQMPGGLSVSAFTMQEKQVSVTVTSSSLSSLDSFMDNLVSLISKDNKNFKEIKQVSLSDSGSDLFSLTLNVTIL